VVVSLVHTSLGSSYLIAHVLHSPPPPRAQLCKRSCSNKHTHGRLGLAPATHTHPGVLGSIPKREEQGKQAHPVLKYRVPHGSQSKHLTAATCRPQDRQRPPQERDPGDIQDVDPARPGHIIIHSVASSYIVSHHHT